MLRYSKWLLFAYLCVAGLAWADQPPTGCDTFSWDMSAELALFAKTGPQGGFAVTAAVQPERAPPIQVGQVYVVTLVEQSGVHFAHVPGKTRAIDSARGGLLSLTVPATGRYRLSLDKGTWIDVTSAGTLIDSNQFQGRGTCPLLHKSVEFTLPAGAPLIVQLSGETSGTVRLAVTPAP